MQTTASTIRTIARRRISRARQLVAALSTALLWTLTSVQVSFAQGGGDGGTGALGTKMDELATNLATLGRPFALVAVTLALLSYIFEPALPEIARDNKGVIRRVLFACIALGLVPDLVGFVLA